MTDLRVLTLANRIVRHSLSFAKSLYFNLKNLLDYYGWEKCSSQSSDYSCWQELPDDILEKIAQNLKLSDRIRSSIVCKSWRSVIMSSPSPAQEFPWLVLPQSPDCRKDKTLSFFSISEGKVVDLKLPKVVQGGWFLGSSKGWLVMIKEQGLNSQMFLLNPISRALRQLPPLATIPSFRECVKTEDWKLYGANFFCSRFSLSTSNINSDECVVAATFGSHRELGLCRPGDKTWSVFHPLDYERDHGMFQLLFSSGKLYALIASTIQKDTIVARTLRFGDQSDHALELMMVYTDRDLMLDPLLGEFVETQEYENHIVHLQSKTSTFLLESTDNEILLIHQVFDTIVTVEDILDYMEGEENDDDVEEEAEELDILEGEDAGDDMEGEENDDDEDSVFGYDPVHNDYYPSTYAQTSHFYIYKIDSKNDGSSVCTRVQSLGDQILFLAERGSTFSFSSTGYEEYGKNCIYFASKGPCRNVIPKPCTSRETGIFYLDTGKIKRSFPSIDFSTRTRINWYIPSF